MNALGEDTSATQYLSTGNLAGVSKQRAEPMTRQECETQKKHVLIVEQLLKEFDMEKTEQKYRSQNVIEVDLDSNSQRYDATTTTMKVRNRLRKLMGTDVIRLNDKRYMDTLSAKLREEHLSNVEKKEKQLAEAELQRLRKLMLEGVIPMETKSQKHKHRKQKHHERSQHDSHRLNKHQSNSYDDIHSKGEKEEKYGGNSKNLKTKSGDDHVEIVTQIQIIEHKDDTEKDETIYEDDAQPSETHEITRTKSSRVQYKQPSDPKQNQTYKAITSPDERKESSRSETPTSRPGTPRTGKYCTIESNLLRQLREAKTVDDLYDIADKVVVKET